MWTLQQTGCPSLQQKQQRFSLFRTTTPRILVLLRMQLYKLTLPPPPSPFSPVSSSLSAPAGGGGGGGSGIGDSNLLLCRRLFEALFKSTMGSKEFEEAYSIAKEGEKVGFTPLFVFEKKKENETGEKSNTTIVVVVYVHDWADSPFGESSISKTANLIKVKHPEILALLKDIKKVMKPRSAAIQKAQRQAKKTFLKHKNKAAVALALVGTHEFVFNRFARNSMHFTGIYFNRWAKRMVMEFLKRMLHDNQQPLRVRLLKTVQLFLPDSFNLEIGDAIALRKLKKKRNSWSNEAKCYWVSFFNALPKKEQNYCLARCVYFFLELLQNPPYKCPVSRHKQKGSVAGGGGGGGSDRNRPKKSEVEVEEEEEEEEEAEEEEEKKDAVLFKLKDKHQQTKLQKIKTEQEEKNKKAENAPPPPPTPPVQEPKYYYGEKFAEIEFHYHYNQEEEEKSQKQKKTIRGEGGGGGRGEGKEEEEKKQFPNADKVKIWLGLADIGTSSKAAAGQKKRSWNEKAEDALACFQKFGCNGESNTGGDDGNVGKGTSTTHPFSFTSPPSPPAPLPPPPATYFCKKHKNSCLPNQHTSEWPGFNRADDLTGFQLYKVSSGGGSAAAAAAALPWPENLKGGRINSKLDGKLYHVVSFSPPIKVSHIEEDTAFAILVRHEDVFVMVFPLGQVQIIPQNVTSWATDHLQKIKRYAKTHENTFVILCGHSMGAAFAQMVAAYYRTKSFESEEFIERVWVIGSGAYLWANSQERIHLCEKTYKERWMFFGCQETIQSALEGERKLQFVDGFMCVATLEKTQTMYGFRPFMCHSFLKEELPQNDDLEKMALPTVYQVERVSITQKKNHLTDQDARCVINSVHLAQFTNTRIWHPICTLKHNYPEFVPDIYLHQWENVRRIMLSCFPFYKREKKAAAAGEQKEED